MSKLHYDKKLVAKLEDLRPFKARVVYSKKKHRCEITHKPMSVYVKIRSKADKNVVLRICVEMAHIVLSKETMTPLLFELATVGHGVVEFTTEKPSTGRVSSPRASSVEITDLPESPDAAARASADVGETASIVRTAKMFWVAGKGHYWKIVPSIIKQ